MQIHISSGCLLCCIWIGTLWKEPTHRVWVTNRDGAVTGDNSGKRGLILDDIDVHCQTYWEKKGKFFWKERNLCWGQQKWTWNLWGRLVFIWGSDSIFQVGKFVTKVNGTEELAKFTSRAIPLLHKTQSLNKTSLVVLLTRRDNFGNPLEFTRRWSPKRSPQFMTPP